MTLTRHRQSTTSQTCQHVTRLSVASPREKTKRKHSSCTVCSSSHSLQAEHANMEGEETRAKRAEASARTGTDKGYNGRRGRRRRHGHKDTKGRGDKRPSEQRVAATSSQSIEPPRSSLWERQRGRSCRIKKEKRFLSWSPNVSVCVVYVFLVTFNSHVQISCPVFKRYFLTGRYGNANRPFLVLLTGSHITATTFNHSITTLSPNKPGA